MTRLMFAWLGARWWLSTVAALWVVLAAALVSALPSSPEPVLDVGYDATPPARYLKAVRSPQTVFVTNPRSGRHNGIEIRGCDDVAEVKAQRKRTKAFRVSDRGCMAHAVRIDGVMPAIGESAWIDQSRESRALRLPKWTAGGLGVSIEFVEEGIRVESVIPGSDARRAGLRPGDVILTADGRDVRGMDVDLFREVVAGPIGSTVSLKVRTRRAVKTVNVERTFVGVRP